MTTEQLTLAPSPFLRPEYEEVVRSIRRRERHVLVPDDPAFVFPPARDPETFEEIGPGGLRPYQHDGVTQLYLTKRVLLADMTGLGKTVQLLRYLQLMKARGDLSLERPAVVVVRPENVDGTWLRDGFQVFCPWMKVGTFTGEVEPRERRRAYAGHWFEVMLLNYPIMVRDEELLSRWYPDGFATVAFDEGSTMKSHMAASSQVAKRLARRAPRTVVMTATPVQTRLEDIHSLLEVLQLNPVFGTPERFAKDYINTHAVERYVGGRRRWVKERDKTEPYRNIGRLRDLLWPYYLRRTYVDIPGEMPEMSSAVKWLEMTPRQAEVYERLRKKELPPNDGNRRFSLQARAMYLRQCATSLQTLVTAAPDESSKLDYFIEKLTDDWDERGYDGAPLKVVVYSTFKPTIVTLLRRLEAVGVGAVVMAGKGDLPNGDPFPWGTSPKDREPLRQRFFNDPTCRVCIGTTAIEMGTNLRVAPLMINLDVLGNPARMAQLAGRIWRKDSPYRFVHVLSLLTRGTLEEGVLRLLESRQDLIDQVNGDDPRGLFTSLSNDELAALVSTDWSAT